ncbi:hypothetical protein ABW19_dt0200106 [Dactylella cylindrospora]|nr:hypothetical protein ABW19_dt0200106 [Dactylella cylindrospora]
MKPSSKLNRFGSRVCGFGANPARSIAPWSIASWVRIPSKVLLITASLQIAHFIRSVTPLGKALSRDAIALLRFPSKSTAASRIAEPSGLGEDSSRARSSKRSLVRLSWAPNSCVVTAVRSADLYL